MNEDKFKKDITKIVDLLIQMDSMREAISEIKKEMKIEHEMPIPTITKIATLIRKQNLDEEDAKWEEIKEAVELCS